jgi:hypothetical protein
LPAFQLEGLSVASARRSEINKMKNAAVKNGLIIR